MDKIRTYLTITIDSDIKQKGREVLDRNNIKMSHFVEDCFIELANNPEFYTPSERTLKEVKKQHGTI